MEARRKDQPGWGERLAYQRCLRQSNGNAHTKKYEKTPRGFLMRVYRNMLSRTKGLVSPRLYKGLSILPKETFYLWCHSHPTFWGLFRTWVQSGYDRKLTPSINRIDNTRGYEIDNIEWITHAANSALGGKARWRKERAGHQPKEQA